MNDEQNIKQLPKDWKWVKLGDVAKVKGGKRLPKGEQYAENKTQFPYLRVVDFENMTVKQTNLKYLTEHTQKQIKNYIITSNDLYISIAGTIGRVGKVPISLSGSNLTENAAKITEIKEFDLDFLSWHLNSILIQNQISEKTIATTQPKLALYRIEKLDLILPPKPIQQDIVSKIEELFSELDKGVETLHTAQRQLKTYRQSVLKWAFEGKLTNENVKEGELPKGWKMVSIEDVANVGTGATPLKSKSEYYGGNISWVTSGALNDKYVKEATDFVTEKAVNETNLSVYPKHTLLVAMYGEGKTRGKCSELLIEACTNQAIAAIYFDDHDISIKPYLKYFLLKNYQDVRKKSSGGVQPNLNLGIIKKLRFPLPLNLEEQNNILQEIESRLSVADKMEESIIQSLQQAEALKQSILKKAFEGRLI